MRNSLHLISRGCQGLAVLLMASLAVAAVPAQAQERSFFQGVWEVVGTPDDPARPTLSNIGLGSADGGLVNVDPALGTGVGDVQRVSGRTHTAVFFGPIDLGGGTIGRYRVDATVDIFPVQGTASGRFRTAILAPDGTELDSWEGSLTATRIAGGPF